MSDKFDSDKAFEKVLASSLEGELMPASSTCPDPGILSAYYEGKLTENEARECERHASTCAACQRQLALLVRLEPKSVASAVKPDVERTEPREARWWSWRWTASAALAATAVLAIVVTYRSRPLMEEAPQLAAGSKEAPASPATAAPEAREKLAFGRAAPSQPKPSPDSGSPSVPEEAAADRAEVPPQNAVAPPPEEMLPTAPPATEPPSAKAPTAAPPTPPSRVAATSPARLPAKASQAVEALPARKAERSTRDQVVTGAAPGASGDLGTVAALRRAESAPGGVTVVSRSNRQVIWRLGSGGMIERSEDSGETWQSQASGETVALLAGSAPSAEVCWVVGKGGAVLRTTDGKRWEKLPSPIGEDLVQVTALGASQATVTSTSGRRFGTDDGGRTWSVR